MRWRTTNYTLEFDRTRVMGIVNVTPDSFSDGGAFLDPSAALAHCERLIREGADLLDIGGESTRPGAVLVDVDEELRRVLPVVAAATSLGVPISVDTSKPAVMRAVLDCGVDIVNDVTALRADGALELLASYPDAGVCLMHMKGTPPTMKSLAVYDDVTSEVEAFLRARVELAKRAGIDEERLAIDPGYGFAKTREQNVTLMREQQRIAALGRPIVAGLSRKSFLGAPTARSFDERSAASLAAGLAAVSTGANVLRVHEVAKTVDALKVWHAIFPAQLQPLAASGR